MDVKSVAFLRQKLAALSFLLFWGALGLAQEQGPGFYVFLKRPQAWTRVYLYTWIVENGRVKETSGPWPGKPLAESSGWYRGFIDASKTDPQSKATRLIFSDGGSQQTADLSRARNGWYVFKDGGTLVQRWFDENPEEKLFSLEVIGGKGSGRFAPGALVTIQADPGPWQSFVEWVGPDRTLLTDTTQMRTSFQMPARDVHLSVSWDDLSSGQQGYEKLCKSCHGAEGQGGVGPSLRLSDGICKSCGSEATLTDRIERTMPLGSVGSCKGICAAQVSHFIRKGLNNTVSSDCTEVGKNLGVRQLRLLTQEEYAASIRMILGVTSVDALRSWPEPSNVQGYSNNAEAQVVSDRHVLVFAKAAKEIAGRTTLEERWGDRCGRESACMIREFGLRLFRRTLSSEEEQQWGQLWKTHPKAGRAVLEGMLQSPAFLYRSELGHFIAPMNAYGLDAFEVASAMAYILTGAPPDEELLAQAAKGALLKSEVRRAQAERLLQTPGARDAFSQFALQWLMVGGLPYVTRDNPSFQANIRRDMLEETKRYVNDIVFDQKGTVEDLFNSDRVFLSKDLARYYGLALPAQDWDLRLAEGPRQGLLGLGAILASFASSREASPIKRGVFVRNRLLCQDLPPPPANVDTTIPPPSPGSTIRERLERHISQGRQGDGSNTCYSCHQYIDKLGFGFEAFDETGKQRWSYPERPQIAIDTSGELKSPENLSDSEVLNFQDLRQLQGHLARSRRVKQCFAKQYLRFALGRIEVPSDQCAVGRLQNGLVQGQSITTFMAEWIASDSFVYRR